MLFSCCKRQVFDLCLFWWEKKASSDQHFLYVFLKTSRLFIKLCGQWEQWLTTVIAAVYTSGFFGFSKRFANGNTIHGVGSLFCCGLIFEHLESLSTSTQTFPYPCFGCFRVYANGRGVLASYYYNDWASVFANLIENDQEKSQAMHEMYR